MNYECKYGLPHDLKIINETKSVKWEICQICTRRFHWNKDYKGRVYNKEYLKIHARNFAQPFGTTKRLFNKIYHPESCVIKI